MTGWTCSPLKRKSRPGLFFRFLIGGYGVKAEGAPLPPEEEADIALAAPWTSIYHGGFIAALAANIPAIYFVKKWAFDLPFISVLAAMAALIFCIFFFHHRHILSFWNSLPLRRGRKNPGAAAYLVLSTVTAALLTPLGMAVRDLLRGG